MLFRRSHNRYVIQLLVASIVFAGYGFLPVERASAEQKSEPAQVTTVLSSTAIAVTDNITNQTITTNPVLQSTNGCAEHIAVTNNIYSKTAGIDLNRLVGCGELTVTVASTARISLQVITSPNTQVIVMAKQTDTIVTTVKSSSPAATISTANLSPQPIVNIAHKQNTHYIQTAKDNTKSAAGTHTETTPERLNIWRC